MADEGEQEPVKPVSVMKLYMNHGSSETDLLGLVSTPWLMKSFRCVAQSDVVK
jgi:hypothetical protein